jgi:flagellar assembly factor FliW
VFTETKRFGKIEYKKSDTISMVRSILGFDSYISFLIISPEEHEPFKWLQSLEEPSLAFLMIDPLVAEPDFVVEIYPNDLAVIGASDINDISVFVFVSIPEGRPELMTANFQAPMIVNKENMNAAQLVLGDSKYGSDHSIFNELENRSTGTSVTEHE